MTLLLRISLSLLLHVMSAGASTAKVNRTIGPPLLSCLAFASVKAIVAWHCKRPLVGSTAQMEEQQNRELFVVDLRVDKPLWVKYRNSSSSC